MNEMEEYIKEKMNNKGFVKESLADLNKDAIIFRLKSDLKEAYESMIDIEYQFNDEFMDNIKLKYKNL